MFNTNDLVEELVAKLNKNVMKLLFQAYFMDAIAVMDVRIN